MICDKIKEIREKTGLNKKAFSELLGVKYTTYNGYETGAREPASDFLILISKKLGVSIDYIMGLSDEKEILRSYKLKSHEMNHIKKYRDLDSHGKKMVDFVVDEETERMEQATYTEEPEQIHTISLQLSQQAAAAGYGVHLGPESFDTITVVDNELTRRAAFAVPVSGDSMEPKYCDGDILLVSHDIPELNDIGIFTMDGEGYVKKRGKDKLISINRHYEAIAMNESIIINGKVIGILEHDWIVEK